MRATCGVVSARRPIMRWLSGSISRKVCSATAAPVPASRLSANSSSGGFTRCVAVRGEHLHQRLDRCRLGLGVGRQQVAQAGGQQRRVDRIVVSHGEHGMASVAWQEWHGEGGIVRVAPVGPHRGGIAGAASRRHRWAASRGHWKGGIGGGDGSSQAVS